MAIIMNQRSRDDAWQPRLDWGDCHIQWGHGGIVFITGTSDSYRTAFFEVFPNDGSAGFLRGEGRTVSDAEVAAHRTWRRHYFCAVGLGHQWSRNRRGADGKVVAVYLNGGCFCRSCGAFQTVMKPVKALGEWRQPLSWDEAMVLSFQDEDAEDGFTDARGETPYLRRLRIRKRVFGVRDKALETDLQPEGSGTA